MKNIENALERARQSQMGGERPPLEQAGPVSVAPGPTLASAMPLKSVNLKKAHLEVNRICTYQAADPNAKPYEMLRTETLQAMDLNSWQVLGITSPTPACGKTVTAINLAMSIANQSHRAALIVDLDLQKPRIANYLGLPRETGVLAVLGGKRTLREVTVRATIEDISLDVLCCERAVQNSSSLMASRAMAALLKDIRREFQDRTIVVDLPPILTGDDVLSIGKHLDCVLFVTAVRQTTINQVKDCARYLETVPVLKTVLNKATVSHAPYYYTRYSEL